MYPYAYLPKPLSAQNLYILLALARSELHTYAIKGAVFNDSLGAVVLDRGRVYRLVEELHGQGLIDLIRAQPARKGTIPRKHYRISAAGTIRLKEEISRLGHIMKIAEKAGLTETGVPLDIQKLLLELKD